MVERGQVGQNTWSVIGSSAVFFFSPLKKKSFYSINKVTFDDAGEKYVNFLMYISQCQKGHANHFKTVCKNAKMYWNKSYANPACKMGSEPLCHDPSSWGGSELTARPRMTCLQSPVGSAAAICSKNTNAHLMFARSLRYGPQVLF